MNNIILQEDLIFPPSNFSPESNTEMINLSDVAWDSAPEESLSCWQKINLSLQDFWGFLHGNSEAIYPQTESEDLEQASVNFFDFDQEQSLLKNNQLKRNAILESTIAWRVPGKELDFDESEVEVQIGIIDGKFQHYIEKDKTQFRSLPAGTTTLLLCALGMFASGLGSYYLFGEGIVTKGLMTAFTTFTIELLQEIPFIPPFVLPATFALGAFFLGNYTKNSLLLEQFLHATCLSFTATSAVQGKRTAKSASKLGWIGAKPYIFPKTSCGTILPEKENQVRLSIQDDMFLTIDKINQEAYTTLEIKGKSYESKKLMNLELDDEDDDDEGIEEKKSSWYKDTTKAYKKSIEKDSKYKFIKELILFTVSGTTTVIAKHWYGEGLLTSSVNQIFSAAIKAKLRHLPFMNAYGLLALPSGALLAVKILNPQSIVGNYAFMPLSIIVSMAGKGLKDLVTGKADKNGGEWLKVPLSLRKTWSRLTGYQPKIIEPYTHPLEGTLTPSNNQLLHCTFGEDVPVDLTITSGRLGGNYRKTFPQMEDLINQKWPEGIAPPTRTQLESWISTFMSITQRATLTLNTILQHKEWNRNALAQKINHEIDQKIEQEKANIEILITYLSEEENIYHQEMLDRVIEIFKIAAFREIYVRAELKQTFEEMDPQFIENDPANSLKIFKLLYKAINASMSTKEQENLSLSQIKPEKMGKWAEGLFIVGGITATLLASLLTKQRQLASVEHASSLPAEKLGEGVVTSIFNSILVTFMKQTGKNFPVVPRLASLGALSAGCIGLERYLIGIDKAPFLFAGIPTSVLLGIVGMMTKKWVQNKEYSKIDGLITKKGFTSEDVTELIKKIIKTLAPLTQKEERKDATESFV